MESKKINQLATELAPDLSDLTIIGDPTTGISKKITLSQMASLFTGTVEEYANFAAFPLVGTADTIYVAKDTNILYRWDTTLTSYVELSPNIVTSLVFSDANGFDGTISLVGSTATLTITTALTTGSVPFIGASGALSQDNANLFFDDTNNRLGINTNAPTTALDVFGSGIIGRINGTSTNNAYLGFASAGTNKWSIGNVQSDHRFRIYNEATTSELVSVLSTGEFGIGIANPTTKIHIDGGASALIANLDANVSVAKSISFRSDNSNRINLEVSGTESGSNAGANFFLRTYTDAGSLIETPFSIVRSTGITTIKSLTLTNVLSIANGGTGSATQNFVDLTTTQSIGGAKTLTNSSAALTLSNAANLWLRIERGSVYNNIGIDSLGAFYNTNSNHKFYVVDGTINVLTLASTGAATFSSSLTVGGIIYGVNGNLDPTAGTNAGTTLALNGNSAANNYSIGLAAIRNSAYDVFFQTGATNGGGYRFYIGTSEKMTMSSTGNLGINTSSPFAKFSIGSPPGIVSFPTYSTSEQASINWYYWAASDLGYARFMDIAAKGAPDGTFGGSIIRFLTNPVTSGSNPSERMRINQDGYLGINTTNPGGRLQVNGAGSSETAFQINDGSARRVFCIPSQYYGYIFAISVAADGGKAISFGSTSQECGSIVCNTSSLTINYSSDYRLKEDFKDFAAIDVLTKVKLYDFKWKAEQTRDYGVIAHELQEIMPNMVTGEKDAFDHQGRIAPQGVDYIRFVPILLKAIQEQQAQIEELKTLINK